jgi:hypothetical protein
MSVTEIRILRRMSEMTREDRIRTEYVKGKIGVVSIVDKKRENRLRCFGHVMRRKENNVVRVIMKINV